MKFKYFQDEIGVTLKISIENYIKKMDITKDQIVSLKIWSNGRMHYGILIHE